MCDEPQTMKTQYQSCKHRRMSSCMPACVGVWGHGGLFREHLLSILQNVRRIMTKNHCENYEFQKGALQISSFEDSSFHGYNFRAVP